MKGGDLLATTRNELRADLRITGDNAVKAGLKSVARAADEAGDEFREMGRDAGYLERKLAELRIAQVALIKELNQSGDVTLIKDINKARRDVRAFERLSKEYAAAGADAGIQFSEGFAQFLRVAPPIAAGIGVLVAGLLPGLGAAVAGAVTGVVGAGGIVGGIVAAAHDPAVKTAFHDLGPALGAAFKTAGEPMVTPLVDALGVLKSEGQSIAHTLQAGFATLAPELVPLTKGLTGLVKEMMPGLLAAFESARPVLRAMAAELPKIGAALGQFFQITAEDSDAAVLGFVSLSRAIENTLVYTGKLLSALGSAYKSFVQFGATATDLVGKAARMVPLTVAALGPAAEYLLKINDDQNEMFKGLIDSMDAAKVTTGSLGSSTNQLTLVEYGLGVALEGSTDELKAQRDAMYGLLNVQLGLIGASVDYERALDKVQEAAKENGKSLDITNEAGRRNVETLEALIEALIRKVQAEYDNAKAQGATEAEAQKAADTLRDKLTKELKAAALAAYGNSAELQKLLTLLDQLNGKRVTYTLIQQGGVTVGAKVDKGTILAGVDDFRAGGGPVEPHKLYRVNESGVELLATGSQSGYVYNASQTAAMMSGSSGGSARPVVNISVQPSGNAALDQLLTALWPLILRQIRIDGGDLGAFGAA